jgi:hypothetical protein
MSGRAAPDIRSLFAAAALALILAGGFQPFYLRIFVQDRAAMKAWITELPYRKTPGLRAFLGEARRHTAPGDVIAFAAPFERWEGGYRYAIRGARYILAGRTVRPLVGPGDEDLSRNLESADVVVAWQADVPPGWETVWSGMDGAVARRVK